MGETSDNLIQNAKKIGENRRKQEGGKEGHLVEVGETSQPRRQFLPGIKEHFMTRSYHAFISHMSKSAHSQSEMQAGNAAPRTLALSFSAIITVYTY